MPNHDTDNPYVRKPRPEESAPSLYRESSEVMAFNRATRQAERHEVIRFLDDAGKVISESRLIVCRDGTRRRIDASGLEGALDHAAHICDAALVPVTIPKAARNGYTAEDEGRALDQVEGIISGREMGTFERQFVGFPEAARRYGYKRQDLAAVSAV
jgi:hypothetical protein